MITYILQFITTNFSKNKISNVRFHVPIQIIFDDIWHIDIVALHGKLVWSEIVIITVLGYLKINWKKLICNSTHLISLPNVQCHQQTVSYRRIEYQYKRICLIFSNMSAWFLRNVYNSIMFGIFNKLFFSSKHRWEL